MSDRQFELVFAMLTFIMRGVFLIIEPNDSLLQRFKEDYLAFLDAHKQ